MDRAEPVAVIGIDIPIGHVPSGRRRADEEARAFVGPRRSSVFAAGDARRVPDPPEERDGRRIDIWY